MAIAPGQRPRPATARDHSWVYVLTLMVLAVVVVFAWGVSRGDPAGGAAGSPVTPPQDESQGTVSQNGWEPISDGSDPRLVPFPWVTGRVRDGDVYTVLSHFADRFHAEIEPIDLDSSWGWDYRPIRGEDDILSNHASGTAIDFNAPEHPLGSTGTFIDEQITRLRELLDELAPVLVWGGDFERPDEMHFEVVGTPEEVAEVAARVAGS